MSREIKFRAWNGRYMVGPDYGDWISFDGVPYTEADKKFDTPNIEVQKAKDYILMQFTGLKDKNGKEIYEGDVFNCKRDKRHKDGGYIAGTYDYHPENAKVVEWRDGAFYVGHELLYAFWSFIKVPGHGQDLIGNIYQNPNLL